MIQKLPWQTIALLLIYSCVVSCSVKYARSGVMEANPFMFQKEEAELIRCPQVQEAGSKSSTGSNKTDEDCIQKRANKYLDLVADQLNLQDSKELETFLEKAKVDNIDLPVLTVVANFLAKHEQVNTLKWSTKNLSQQLIPSPFPALNLPIQKNSRHLVIEFLSEVELGSKSNLGFEDVEIKILENLLESIRLSQTARDKRFWLELLYGPEQLLIFLVCLWSVQKFLSANKAIAQKQQPVSFRWAQFWAGTVLILGFVGTVRGMYAAIPFLSQALGGPGVNQSTAISSMASTLGPAFATTLIALLLSILLSAFEQRTREIADEKGIVLPS